MYFHGSPTTKQLKQLKRLKADEMRRLLQAMQQVTTIYTPLIQQLEDLRAVELQVSSLLSTHKLTPDQALQLQAKIDKKQRAMANKINNFLSVK